MKRLEKVQKEIEEYKTYIRNCGEELKCLKKIKSLYPDAEKNEIDTTRRNHLDGLHFTTSLPLKMNSVTTVTNSDRSILLVCRQQVFDKTIFHQSPNFVAKFEKITISNFEVILGHHNKYDGYVLDCPEYIPNLSKIKDKSLKQDYINTVKMNFVKWIINNESTPSWEKMEEEVRNLPLELKEMIKNHFIIK